MKKYRSLAVAVSMSACGCAAGGRPAATPAGTAAQRIDIDAHEIVVNGRRLVTIAELEEVQRENGPLAYLAFSLPIRADRGGAQELKAERAAPTYWAMNAMWTAALIGYRSVRVEAGGTAFDGWYELPHDAPPDVHDALVLHDAPDGVHVLWKSDRPCDEVPPDATVPRDQLAAHLARVCGARTPCIDTIELYASASTTFADAVRTLAAARSRAKERVPFALHGPDSDPRASGRRVCGRPVRTPLAAPIAPAVIQRVARAGYPRMRACYEHGLMRDPELEGKVVTDFAIEEDGRVAQSEPADGTTIEDPAVVACVLGAFRGLAFPPLGEGKRVRVVYPVIFERDAPPVQVEL